MTNIQQVDSESASDSEQSPPEFIGGSADARGYRRRSVLWPAKLIVGSHDFQCQIWNMSLGGARVRLDLPIREGAAVRLIIAGRGEIPATVRWFRNDTAGLSFNIPAEEVRLLFIDQLQSLGLEPTESDL